jgi:hypothetical protein
MNDRHLYLIDDDLSDGWLEAWIEGGLAAAEEYLGRRATFDTSRDPEE